ncbi:MAG TPA: ECF transporter S component [Halanaerobiales bacterium]|nr:ECF transporter S component [Halanaerobiales bacterium]
MNLSTRKIVISGMLGAISIILGATGLGLIPVPTPAGHATIMHVPAIIGGVLEGPVVGFFIGLIFGIFSFIRATNPIFADPLIAVVPRLFIGVGAYYIYYLLKKYNVSFALILAGIIGTLINTIFVLGLAVLRGYLPFKAAASVAFLHGIPEVILAAVIVVIVGKAILSIQKPSGAKN